MGRIYGYVRASIDPRVESPQVQKKVIEDYCRRFGRQVDGMYVDRAASGKLHLLDREAGRHLLLALRRGDHVIVARMDTLASSFVGSVRVLDDWRSLGVTMHLCDVPGGVLDPNNPTSRLLIEMLVRFAEHDRRMIGLRTRESFADLKAAGRRHSRFAPFGFKWEKRGGKTYMVPEPKEQAICIRVAELDAEGYSVDQIRQYLAYEWKVRNRKGNEFGHGEVDKMALRGSELQLAAELQPA